MGNNNEGYELMEIMVHDWFLDHNTNEYETLKTYGYPYVDEDGIWHQDLIDTKDSKTYTLRDHDGELILIS